MNPVNELLTLTSADVFIGVLEIVMRTMSLGVIFFTKALFGNCALVMWAGASALKDLVCETVTENDKLTDVQFKTIRGGLKELEVISELLNKIWYVFNFMFVLDIIAWLSTELDNGLRTEDWFVRINRFYFWGYFGVSLLLSGEAFRKVPQSLRNCTNIMSGDSITDRLINWSFSMSQMECIRQEFVCRLGQDLEQDVQLHFLIRTTRHANIGLGSMGFYHINYAFIGQVSTIVIPSF